MGEVIERIAHDMAWQAQNLSRKAGRHKKHKEGREWLWTR